MDKSKPEWLFYGYIKTKNGTYLDKETNKEKNRYHSVGKLFVTPHFSQISVLMLPTATTDEKWLSVFAEDNFKNRKSESKNNLEINDNEIYQDF